MMNENLSEVLKREMDSLLQEKTKGSLSTQIKKTAFIEDIKNDVGKTIKNEINNPNRHNPKKLSFWTKFKKAIGC